MATLTLQRDGKMSGGNAMGRVQDLTDFPAYVAGAYLKVDGGGTKLEMATGVVYGDLEFSDLTCTQCGKAFTEGDKLVLVVVRVEAGKIKTRPAHHNCIGG